MSIDMTKNEGKKRVQFDLGMIDKTVCMAKGQLRRCTQYTAIPFAQSNIFYYYLRILLSLYIFIKNEQC